MNVTSDLVLNFKFSRPVYGWWDGGAKSSFDFSVERFSYSEADKKVRVGSWSANVWYMVPWLENERKTLEKARQFIKRKIRPPDGVTVKSCIMDKA